tara:strand:- start:825 stop:2060 length:1236 start_codon:yes stop_codon:yes gene_type:complete
MGIYYAESNKESTRDLFNKRNIYWGTLASTAEEYKNLVNFNFGEKLLYGRVNRLFMPIVPARLPIKAFNKSNAAAKNLRAASFVVDAFNDLNAQFKRCAASGQISKDDTFLSNLVVYKAYQDPQALYGQYLSTYQTTIATEFTRRKIRVKNFDEFLTEVEILLEKSARRFPFTLPAYIKSRLCPMNCSGLVVEIADLNYTNDEEKINRFVKSKNWEFYVNACRSYGFMVDRFVPWRLVADIGSSPMIAYAANYGLGGTDLVLNGGYTSADLIFYKQFKFFLLGLYNKVKLKNFLEVEYCNGSTKNNIIVPQSYTPAQIENNYPDSTFLKLYFKIRFWEEESQFKAFEEEMLIDDSLELYYNQGRNTALQIFERILNKTFDYRGSLSYIIEYIHATSTEASRTLTSVSSGNY